MAKILYSTDLGKYYLGECTKQLKILAKQKTIKGKVQLIITSPPFPLNKKKEYGNLEGDEYVEWISKLAPLFSELLAEDGSIVIEIGNGWEKGRPVQSLLSMKSLIAFLENPDANLRLCQEFICYNPARLPSPAQWVTINRIRTIDSFTHVWWMAKSDYPKADNKKVLRPYSKSMEKLFKKGTYNAGKRPSDHIISEDGFLTRHEGSIMPNFLEFEPVNPGDKVRLPQNTLKIANTKSNDYFTRRCKKLDMVPHPARMPMELVSFFIEFLTDEGDLVLDPFGGSNTTGFCAERLKRRWISIELNSKYGKQSAIRFEDPTINANLTKGSNWDEY
ncbi:MAG: Methyltransferase [Sporanaerobacter sp.]|jgi:DNA modification methylase|uniref:DNA-methyltransferase n=1 Tax=Sporanaerobacter sp. TaxID=2010183 RepID=UPI003A0FD0B3